MDLDDFRTEIALRRELGASRSDVQRSVIDAACELSDEQRAALWLFASSYPSTNAHAARPLDEDRSTEPGPHL